VVPRLLDPLVEPLTDLLMLLTSVLHSYGLAIIIFTILVRAALTPLTLRQLRSAKRMAALAPRLKQLQQTYKGNREELVRAQMALYKETGANPAAGCLPLLLQMPILYALFFVFQDLAHPRTPALYHQPFLWFRLDQPDHLFGAFGPLPLLAGLTQWVQSRMMVQPTSDPQQRLTQQLMQVLPLMIIVFAVTYPAGLALYWVVTTLCSIVLQYFVTGWGALFSSPLHVPEALPQNGVAAGPRHSTAPVLRGSETGMRDTQVTTARAEGARLGKMQRAALRSPSRAHRRHGAQGKKRGKNTSTVARRGH
jgi:YidC/Oxa1 family membrane protein insertase